MAVSNNCNQYRSYLGYGQVVTSNDPADQQSALANLDQVPYANGTGKSTLLPLQFNRDRVLYVANYDRRSGDLPEQRSQLWLGDRDHRRFEGLHHGPARDVLVLAWAVNNREPAGSRFSFEASLSKKCF